ncbi:MAG: hypothetical protein Q4B69_05955 [Slackia sp.]|nr:hypothetical protein [Slackia sp.]
MEDSFPLELGMRSKRELLAGAPDAFGGRFVGLLRSGVALPEGGAFYLAQFESRAMARARIVAYVDKYGRVFSTDGPLEVPPARYPSLEACVQEGTNDTRGVIVAYAHDGAMAQVGIYDCENPGQNGRFRIDRLEGANAPASVDGWLSYDAFMAHVFFALIASMFEQRASHPFDLGAVFARFDSLDLFDAVNREILEVESAVAERSGQAPGAERYLAAMLHDAGIVGKALDDMAVELAGGFRSVPAARLLRTVRYADTYYVDFYYADASGSPVENGMFSSITETAEARRVFLRTEAALNRFLLLCEYLEDHWEGGVAAADEAFCVSADAWLCDRICAQATAPEDAPLLESRWDKHLAFARACESLRLPYRIGYEFCSNEAATIFGIEILCPESQVMAARAWNEQTDAYVERSIAERNGDAARYAAHAVILFAAQAFGVSSDIASVKVNCLFGGCAGSIAIAGAFEREAFARQFAADAEHAFADPFAFLRACGIAFDFGDGFAMREVPACFVRGEGDFVDTREPLTHRDAVPFSQEARDLAGVFAPCDLSIFEDGERARIAEEVVEALDAGIDAATERLKAVHDRTENILIRRICRALMDGFMLGELDEHSYLEVKEAFLDAYGFKPLMARATALVRSGEESQAIEVLEELLAKVEATEGFADTAQTCYRFFDSYETRYMYARHCADDCAQRRVMSLPDEAFLVHDALAQVYTTSISGADAALAHAKRCIELAPARAHSYLRAARAYFMRGEYEFEAGMCAKALEVAWHPADAGLALYWMAYAFWKLERYDAAAACYRRCAALHSTMADQAMVEFEELLENVKGLQRHTEEEENDILRKQGVPVGALTSNCESLLEMAKASADSGCTSLCCVLAASGMRVIRDDALMPVVKSFASAVKGS